MRTYISMNNLPLPDPFPSMKGIVEEVIKNEGYEDTRAFKMDLNDFLCLLAAFNAKGVHFS